MKLCLGTAQFGGAYGITNINEMPSEDHVYKLLDVFFEAGYSFLDTAQEYGDAHKRISQWHQEKYSLSKSELNVITKIYIKSTRDIELFQDNVVKICEDLGLKSIYGILIHNPSNMQDLEGWGQINHQFKSLKELGIVKKTGVSVYTPTEFFSVYDKISEINIVQCPINVLDQRFLQPKIQGFFAKKGIEIHARSLFLQGLLLSASIPEKILNADVRRVLESYKKFLKKNQLTALEACYQFAYQNQKKVARWIVGFNLPRELEEFLFQINQRIVRSDISFDEFENNDSYIDPRTWSYIKSC
jgi:aryl-alcohol dehydrogenase-like predicted oxidoreductase